MRRLTTAICVLSTLLSLAACNGGERKVDRGARESVLYMGNSAEPQDLDPHVVTGMTEHRILFSLFEGLVGLDMATLTPIPAAAEAWSVSDDQTVYTFTIRASAKWSNGEPVTAHDFVYAFNRILSPKFGSEYADMLYCIVNARNFHQGKLHEFSQVGTKALADRTLEIRLANPTPYFLSMHIHFAWFPVHKATIEKFGAMDQRGTPWTRAGNMVSNGPFQLEVWEPNKIIRAVKNAHYWGADTVRLNAIEFYPIDSQQTEEHSFRSGELHLTADIPINKIEVYQRDHPALIHIYPYFGVYFYRFNVTRKPFDDVRVRRAFAMAIDRGAIVKNVTKGGQLPAAHFVPPNSTPPGQPAYTSPAGITFNPEEAKRLLAEAGYPKGQGLPPIEILFNTSESHKQIAEAAQNMWKVHLNADVTLVNQDWKVYLASMSNLDYQVARSAWIGDYLDPFSFLDCFVTGRGNNRTGYSSEAYDTLLAKSTQTKDLQERVRLLEEAEQVLLDDAPFAPVYFYTRMYLQSPQLKGVQSNPLSLIDYTALYFEP